ncbi:MAG: flagellar M-ring protein FliF, partial [Ghiorsea sp.]|nr:flagellar M-ring protein FliF [Ghiorsea sp.]
SGNMLSAMDEQQPAGEGQGMLDYQAKLEQGYEVRLTSMLEQIVGSGQAVVRVTTAINREHVESNAQIYNPDEQVLRSSKTVKESRKAVDGVAMGVPGMTSNNPDSVNPDGSLATQSPPSEEATRNENTANYEISSRTEHRIVPFGTIEKVSIAVIVGGSYKEGENGDKTFVPRSDEELRTIKTLVQNAVGFNEDRGDSVEVQSMPLMDLSSAAAVDMEGVVDKTFYLELMRYGLAMLALILIAFFIMKPLAKRISESKNEELKALGLDANGVSITGAESEHVAQMNKARSAVLNNPGRASRVVNEWVSSV